MSLETIRTCDVCRKRIPVGEAYFAMQRIEHVDDVTSSPAESFEMCKRCNNKLTKITAEPPDTPRQAEVDELRKIIEEAEKRKRPLRRESPPYKPGHPWSPYAPDPYPLPRDDIKKWVEPFYPEDFHNRPTISFVLEAPPNGGS